MNNAKAVQGMIGAGKPVLLEFQSPYWLACTALKPVVDELEHELDDQIQFIRLNIQEKVGMELAPKYGFEYTPTFIYFDAQGNELWRTVGEFDPQKIRDSLKWASSAALHLTFGISANLPGIAASPRPNYFNLSNPIPRAAPSISDAARARISLHWQKQAGR